MKRELANRIFAWLRAEDESLAAYNVGVDIARRLCESAVGVRLSPGQFGLIHRYARTIGVLKHWHGRKRTAVPEMKGQEVFDFVAA